MDIVAALSLIALCALVVGFASGNFVAWMRAEWRQMRSYHWIQDERPVATMADPRCQKVSYRLAEARMHMKRERIPTLLEGRAGWRKVVVSKGPQRSNNVTQLRRNR